MDIGTPLFNQMDEFDGQIMSTPWTPFIYLFYENSGRRASTREILTTFIASIPLSLTIGWKTWQAFTEPSFIIFNSFFYRLLVKNSKQTWSFQTIYAATSIIWYSQPFCPLQGALCCANTRCIRQLSRAAFVNYILLTSTALLLMKSMVFTTSLPHLLLFLITLQVMTHMKIVLEDKLVFWHRILSSCMCHFQSPVAWRVPSSVFSNTPFVS